MKNGGKAMALKKYRFAVGICGPTVLYTNIIRAEDERSAAMIYLSEIGKDLTDENISEQLRHIKGIVPKEARNRLLDYLGKEIVLGDEVMFYKKQVWGSSKIDAWKGRQDFWEEYSYYY